MKVIFLDFDGVLATNQSYALGHTPYGPYPFDKGCIEQLNRLIELTGAKIVVSSSWRGCADEKALAHMREVLAYEGVKGEVIGVTPRLNGFRGSEVERWINDQGREPVTYVILDDDSDFHSHQKPFFIHTKWDLGLCASQVDRAVAILNGADGAKDDSFVDRANALKGEPKS